MYVVLAVVVMVVVGVFRCSLLGTSLCSCCVVRLRSPATGCFPCFLLARMGWDGEGMYMCFPCWHGHVVACSGLFCDVALWLQSAMSSFLSYACVFGSRYRASEFITLAGRYGLSRQLGCSCCSIVFQKQWFCLSWEF